LFFWRRRRPVFKESFCDKSVPVAFAMNGAFLQHCSENGIKQEKRWLFALSVFLNVEKDASRARHKIGAGFHATVIRRRQNTHDESSGSRVMFLKRTLERIGDVLGLAILLTGLLVGSNLLRGRMRSAPMKRRAAAPGAASARHALKPAL